ncbi:MAG: hypothetical protein IPI14_11955 [Polaromonas sp.]|nr:hypothetical protein [Polaromonas sp.]
MAPGTKRQTCTQGVGQGRDRCGGRIGHGAGQGVGDGLTNRHGVPAAGLAVLATVTTGVVTGTGTVGSQACPVAAVQAGRRHRLS